jgi:hypothetical protein
VSGEQLAAFVAIADPDTGQARIERWDVGTGDRIGTGLPLGLLAVVDDEGVLELAIRGSAWQALAGGRS